MKLKQFLLCWLLCISILFLAGALKGKNQNPVGLVYNRISIQPNPPAKTSYVLGDSKEVLMKVLGKPLSINSKYYSEVDNKNITEITYKGATFYFDGKRADGFRLGIKII